MNIKMNLRARLLASFGVVLLLTLLLALWSVRQLHVLQGNTETIAKNWLPSVELSGAMNGALGNLRLSYVRLSITEGEKERGKYAAELAKNRKDFDTALKQYLPLVSSPAESELAQKLQSSLTRYHADGDQLLTLVNAGRLDEAQKLNSTTMRDNGWAVRDIVGAIVKLNHEGAEAESKAADDTYVQAMWSVAVATGLAILIGLVLAWRIAADLSRRISSAALAADRFAAGDLTHRLESQGSDEVAQLLQAMQRMQQQLAGLVSEVRGNAESVATASAEISQGNADLSQRTEEQASALQQTAASMEQINGTAQSNADNAAQASQLANQAAGVAEQGSQVVSEVVNTMRDIEQASRQMEDIISVIDGIAFQTNILALNAAVEAARAGEQGRGFAVVAGEVRSLAQRSAEAARQVKTLINTSVSRVEAGSSLVEKAGSTMLEVKSSVQRVSDIVGEIAAGSREQMAGVSQVSEAVSQMDQTTQQNAALVEESAAAAESLRQQADTLVSAVSVFHTGQRDGVTAPRPATLAGNPVPQRATNVARPEFGRKSGGSAKLGAVRATPARASTAVAATGTDGEWASF